MRISKWLRLMRVFITVAIWILNCRWESKIFAMMENCDGREMRCVCVRLNLHATISQNDEKQKMVRCAITIFGILPWFIYHNRKTTIMNKQLVALQHYACTVSVRLLFEMPHKQCDWRCYHDFIYFSGFSHAFATTFHWTFGGFRSLSTEMKLIQWN